MDKDVAKVIENNQDVVDFIRKQLDEEPDLSEEELRQRTIKDMDIDTWRNVAPRMIIFKILICAARKGKEGRKTVG